MLSGTGLLPRRWFRKMVFLHHLRWVLLSVSLFGSAVQADVGSVGPVRPSGRPLSESRSVRTGSGPVSEPGRSVGTSGAGPLSGSSVRSSTSGPLSGGPVSDSSAGAVRDMPPPRIFPLIPPPIAETPEENILIAPPGSLLELQESLRQIRPLEEEEEGSKELGASESEHPHETEESSPEANEYGPDNSLSEPVEENERDHSAEAAPVPSNRDNEGDSKTNVPDTPMPGEFDIP